MRIGDLSAIPIQKKMKEPSDKRAYLAPSSEAVLYSKHLVSVRKHPIDNKRKFLHFGREIRYSSHKTQIFGDGANRKRLES